MPDEKKTRAVPPTLATKEKPAIPVKLLLFKSIMNIPGESSADKVKCNPEKRGKYWTVDYIPALRHHELTFYPADEHQQVERAYIHESHVGRWDPA